MGSTPIKSSAKWGSKVGGQNYAGTNPAEMARRNAAYALSSVEGQGLDARVTAALVSYGLPNVGTYMAAARECNKTIKKHSGPILIAELTAIAGKWADAMGLDLTILYAMILSVFGITLAPPTPPTCNAGPDDFLSFALNYTLAGAGAANYVSLLWTTSGDGVFNDATVLNPVYTPGVNDLAAEEAFLTLTAQPIPPSVIPATDTMKLDIVSPPSCNAGPDDSINAGDTYPIPSASAIADSSILWVTSGDGSFDDDGLITATYTPGPVDQVIGVVVLTLTAYPIQPQTSTAVDALTLTIVPIASQYTMNTPNGGESWTIGNPYTVAWISTAADPFVRIDESTDGGGTWNPIAVGLASGIGFRTWGLYIPAGPPCVTTRLRITSQSNPINTCQSAADFSKV
jgi:hypothetical protein